MKQAVTESLITRISGSRMDSLGNDIVMIENPAVDGQVVFPIQSTASMSVIVVSGSMECVVDMTEYSVASSGILIILPSQILERISFSSCFCGFLLVMSEKFVENLPVGNTVPVLSDVRQRCFYPLDEQSMSAVVNYAKMVQGALQARSNSYRYEIVMHLTVAYYYGLGTYIHDIGGRNRKLSRYERISNDFIELVRKNCHKCRSMDFYASAMFLSAKHISTAVKQVTGLSAMKWIEKYTVLNAKNMLKTTSLTVSEISDRLNFLTPSDFGKYFRKYTGCTPARFRNM